MRILPIAIVAISAALALPAIAGINSLIRPVNDETISSDGSATTEKAAKEPEIVLEEKAEDDVQTSESGELNNNEKAAEGYNSEADKPEIVEAPEDAMTFERMAEIVLALDPGAQVQLTMIQFQINNIPMTIVADPVRNRMRAFTPFKSLDGVDGRQLYRMMQSNFDTTLDARYAIAQGFLIAAFIHPLRELDKNQLIEGLGQVVNLVLTYGTAYSSGALTFGGGDSGALHRQLIDDLLKKGEEI